MKKNQTHQSVKLLLCGFLVLSGCIFPHDRLSIPEKVENLPNTFYLKGNSIWGEKVVRVEVWTYSPTTPMEPAWRIVAKEEVPLKGFTITAGQIPPGFEQLIPAGAKKFHLIPGHEYGIAIITDLHQKNVGIHPLDKRWIAEPSKESDLEKQ